MRVKRKEEGRKEGRKERRKEGRKEGRKGGRKVIKIFLTQEKILRLSIISY